MIGFWRNCKKKAVIWLRPKKRTSCWRFFGTRKDIARQTPWRFRRRESRRAQGLKFPPTGNSSSSKKTISARNIFSPARNFVSSSPSSSTAGFENALEMVRQIFEVGGKGHSCGIYSFNDDRIHRLALMAPVSRIMVRQPQSKANAGAFNNGMPMTSSLGCGTWGGNITSENIHLKHYMNVTWVSRPIPEDRPSEEELFGEFYNTEAP